MRIEVTTSEALSRKTYSAIADGKVYFSPGCVLVVEENEKALLLVYDEKYYQEQQHCGGNSKDLEEAIRAAL